MSDETACSWCGDTHRRNEACAVGAQIDALIAEDLAAAIADMGGPIGLLTDASAR